VPLDRERQSARTQARRRLAAFGDVSNLKPLRSFVAYGSSSGDRSTFAAFLEIK